MVLRIFLIKTFFFLQEAIVLTCFQSEKSQNKLDLLQSVLFKRFTELVQLNFRGCEAKQPHLSNFQLSVYLNRNQITI